MRDLLFLSAVLLAVVWLEAFAAPGRGIRVPGRGNVVFFLIWLFAAAAGFVLRRLSPGELSMFREISLFVMSMLAAFSMLIYTLYRGLPIWLGFLKKKHPDKCDRYDQALGTMQKHRLELIIAGGVLINLGPIIRLLLMSLAW